MTSGTDAATIANPGEVDRWNLSFAGPMTLSGTVGFANGGGITEAGTATLQSQADIANDGAPGVLSVASTGTLTKSPSGAANIQVLVSNSGSVKAVGGTLSLASIINDGILDLGQATVDLGSAFAPPSGSVVESTIGGGTAGVGYGQLDVSGTVALAGTLTVSTANGYAPVEGQTFAILVSTGATSGSYTFDQSGAPTGLSYDAEDLPAGVTVVVDALPSNMAATAGTTPQSKEVGTPFVTLEVVVTDSFGDPVDDLPVTFTAPSTGPSGRFTNGTNTYTVATNSSGDALATTFTANDTAGAYTVTASSTGLTPVDFALTNSAGPPAILSVLSGATESVPVGGSFHSPLEVSLTDSFGNPLSGLPVTFSAPTAGPSATFASCPDTPQPGHCLVETDSQGDATLQPVADTTSGTYSVSAASSGLTPVGFSLTNEPGPATVMTEQAGSSQSAPVGSTFSSALEVSLADSFGNPVPGVAVTFAAPTSGPTSTFPGCPAGAPGLCTVTTDGLGHATAAVAAGTRSGGPYTVSATSGTLSAVAFSLTNTAGPPATLTILGGTERQQMEVGTPNNGLDVLVSDQYGNPLPGVAVTFEAPASGPSGTFATCTSNPNSFTCVEDTDASGDAETGFTANTHAGGYQVQAAGGGLAAVDFTFTNLVGPSVYMTVVGGTPQSATVTTSFSAPLEVSLTDAYGNPEPSQPVTFTAPSTGPSGTFPGCGGAVPDSCVVSTDDAGQASVPFTANDNTGGPYEVSAASTGVSSVEFALTNQASPLTLLDVVSGAFQASPIASSFDTALTVQAVDSLGQPVAGVDVTFRAPSSGASGSFGPCPGGNPAPSECVVITDSAGQATASRLTANHDPGRFTVTATAPGVPAATFSLTNSGGYWLVGGDGGVFSFGAPFYGSTGGIQLNKPVIGITASADGQGYWLFASDGGVFTYGDARFRGSTGGITLAQPVVGMAADPATGGYWLVARDGGVFSFGAPFYGSLGGAHLEQPIVGMVVAPEGTGYWLVSAGGSVYNFGPGAQNYGSVTAGRGGSPIVGMASDVSGTGYWVATAAGQVFTFGSAQFHGSTLGVALSRPVVSIVADPVTGGYWLLAADGGVFDYDAPFEGSASGFHLNAAVTSMATNF